MTERTEVLRVRVTLEERAAIEQAAAENRQSVSEYIRQACQNRPSVPRSTIADLTRNVIGAAVNVNQIAATANKTKNVTTAQLEAVLALCEKMHDALGKIIDAVNKPHKATEELQKTRRTVLRLLEKLDELGP